MQYDVAYLFWWPCSWKVNEGLLVFTVHRGGCDVYCIRIWNSRNIGLGSLGCCSGMSSLFKCIFCMYICSYGRRRFGTLIDLRRAWCFLYFRIHVYSSICAMRMLSVGHYSLYSVYALEISSAIFWGQELLKMGPIGCPETSVWNYHDSLRSNLEARSSLNTLRTGLLNCLNARSRGLTFRHRESCI